jgi:hypothetical protein
VYDSRIPADAARYRVGAIDTALTFGVSGILRASALVMYDRATVSLWSLEGHAIAGPLRGVRLRAVPSERVPWAAWRRRHPRTLVMGPPPPGRAWRDIQRRR